MDWPGFFQGVAESVVSALLWTGAAWFFYFLRHKYVERQLRGAFSRIGVHTGHDSFGVTIKNESEFSVIVRDVALLNENKSEGFQLRFLEPTTDYLFTEKQTNKPMTIKLLSIVARKELRLTPQGFVELPTQSGSIWALPKRFFQEQTAIVPSLARAVIEYKTLLGNTKLIIVESNERSAAMLRDSFKKFMEQKP